MTKPKYERKGDKMTDSEYTKDEYIRRICGDFLDSEHTEPLEDLLAKRVLLNENGEIKFPACTDCGDPVDVLYLHSECHPTSPTWTRAEAEDGKLIRFVVECAECEQHIFTYEINDQN